MDSKLYTVLNRLSLGLRCRVRIHGQSEEATAATDRAVGRRCYYHTRRQAKTSAAKTSASEQEKEVFIDDLKRFIDDLCKRRRFNEALQVFEWMNYTRICKFTPSDHAFRLDLIGRVQGLCYAENYFSSLPEQDKNNETYGALLNCYMHQCPTMKYLLHLRSTKVGWRSSPPTYNDIMCEYTTTDELEKVPEVLADMKKNNVSPDNYSYRICINSFGLRSDLEGMEKMLKEMESQPHIAMDWNTYALAANFYAKEGLADKAIDALKKAEVRLAKEDVTGFNLLISLYAKLGKKDEVFRLWELEKSACKRCEKWVYMNVLESFVKLGEFEEAKKMVTEWDASDNCYDFNIPNIVILGYCEKAVFEEAEEMLQALTKEEKFTSRNSWGIVAAGYLDKGQMRKAFECMKTALSLKVEDKDWKPKNREVMSLLSWVGEHESVSEAESFLEKLRTVVPLNREMYYALLKAYVQSDKDIKGLLDKMRTDKLDEDGETKRSSAKGKVRNNSGQSQSSKFMMIISGARGRFSHS